jgi:uncharacterized membrane protein YphA (DoxX/SURF4 family)
LFSTFAYGAPGVGLLLLRLTAGSALIFHGTAMLFEGARGGSAAIDIGKIMFGALLLVGLWTPVAGVAVAIGASWLGLSRSVALSQCVFIGILGAALALLGPGAWSVDAWLYGWKRFDIPDSRHKDDEAD